MLLKIPFMCDISRSEHSCGLYLETSLGPVCVDYVAFIVLIANSGPASSPAMIRFRDLHYHPHPVAWLGARAKGQWHARILLVRAPCPEPNPLATAPPHCCPLLALRDFVQTEAEVIKHPMCQVPCVGVRQVQTGRGGGVRCRSLLAGRATGWNCNASLGLRDARAQGARQAGGSGSGTDSRFGFGS